MKKVILLLTVMLALASSSIHAQWIANATSAPANTSFTSKVNVGIGYTTSGSYASRLCIKGSGTTSSTSSLNILNSSSASMFFVRDDGNVGINNSSPSYKLDISGTLRTTGQIKSSLATGTAPFAVTSTTLNTNLNADLLDGFHASSFQTVLTNPVTGAGTTYYIPKFTGTTTMGNSQIYDNGSFVGIGITSPSRTLHVQTSQTNGGIRVTQTSSGFSAMELYNSTTGGHNYALVSTGKSNSEGAGAFGIYDYTISGYRMFINSSGNIGIGTLTPSTALDIKNGNLYVEGSGSITVNHTATGDWEYALSVVSNRDYTKAISVNTPSGTNVFMVWGNGVVNAKKVYAEELQVTPTSIGTYWPDFVFDKKYDLLSLSKLEEYIKQNNHLPNVLSTEEVSKSGYNVSQMNAVLLQKIEELTLYVIDLQKQIQEMKK